jgi:hypothetical protein
VPKVLQAKSKVSSQPTNQAARTPVAPPVYRPQPTPRVLQTKKAVGQQSGAGQRGGKAVAPTAPAAPAAPARRPEQKGVAQPQMSTNALLRQQAQQQAAPVSRSLPQPSPVEQNRAGVRMPNPGGRNQFASHVIQRKFIQSNIPGEWVWENKDKSQTGRYRWLMKQVTGIAKFFLDLTVVTNLGLNLAAIDVNMVDTLLDNNAIVLSSGKSPRILSRGDVSFVEKTSMVTSLLKGHKPHQTSGDIAKMNFRFSEASGEFFYSSDTPPVEPSKHPKVKFKKVAHHRLEEIRGRVNELEPQHYRERVIYPDWVYVREQTGITMLERKDRSVFAWGAEKEKRPYDADDLTDDIKDDILLRMSKLQRPKGSGPVRVTSELKNKERDGSQEAAMDNINASAYALAAREPNAAGTDWDWLHIRGARLGGSTTSDNLVCGTFVANSHMIPIEHDLLELSKLASREQPLIITWDATTTHLSHMGALISIELHAPNGLDDGAEVILPKKAHCRWVFNPTTGAILDRLDRDLQWGVNRVAKHHQQYQEPKPPIQRPFGSGPSPSTLALATVPSRGGSMEHMHSGSAATGSMMPLSIMSLQQSPVIAEVSGRDAMAFFQSFQNPQALFQMLNPFMRQHNLILEMGMGFGAPVFMVPGDNLTFVGQVPSSGGTFFSGLLEQGSATERSMAERQNKRHLEYVRVHHWDPTEAASGRHASLEALRHQLRSMFANTKRLKF